MNDPSQIMSLIHRYLDGGASAEELSELDVLLRESPEAAEAFARAGRLDASLQALTQEQAGIDKEQAVLASLDRALTPRRRRVWPGVAAAAAILVVLGVVAVQRLTAPPDRPPGPRGIEVVEGRVSVNGVETAHVPSGALVEVLPGETARVRLDDGSWVELEPASRVVLHGTRNGTKQVVELIDGAGRFASTEEEDTMEVETPFGRVNGRGAEFTVRLATAALHVAVVSGSVQVEAAGKPQLVKAGENRRFVPRETRGAIKAIIENGITVTDEKDRPVILAFTFAPNVRVTVDGRPATTANLAAGMVVYYQTGDSGSVLTSVRAEGPTVHGVLRRVDEKGRTITLAGRRSEGKPNPDMAYPLAPNAEITRGQEPAKLSDLTPGIAVTLRLGVDRKTVIAISQGGKRKGDQ